MREFRMIDQELLENLQEGGHILYIRHGEAIIGIDQQNLLWEDCRTQRNLSEKGRKQAYEYGTLLREWNIPIEIPVRTSPFCRAKETASLAFGNDSFHIEPFWYQTYLLNRNLPLSMRISILSRFYAFLEDLPVEGKNRIVIAHSFPPGQGLGMIPDMGTVVVKPNGAGRGYSITGRFTLEELVQLGKV